jgi:protein gp37
MGAATKIEWCDHTASPWHGCTKVATGCLNCYAEKMSIRNPSTLGVWGENGVRVKSKSFIKNLRKWNKEAEAAGKPVTVFPSICDPFEDRPELVPWRQEMFAVADECPWVILLLLTKRPENIRGMWPAMTLKIGGTCGPGANGPRGTASIDNPYRPHVWLGTSCSTQADADRNIPLLLQCRDLSPCLFVSAEPLVEEVAFRSIKIPGSSFDTGGGFDSLNPLTGGMWGSRAACGGSATKLDWVIIGGESGPGARPCNIAWVRSLIKQCRAAGVPVFVKQLGAQPVMFSPVTLRDEPWPINDPKGGDPAEWPEDLQVREFPNCN